MPRARLKSKNGGAEKLAAWTEALKTAPEVLDGIAQNAAEELVGLVQEGFRSETDPYGKAWKPKQAADGRKTLSGPTGRLKTGWHTTPRKRGFSIAPSVNYAGYHQTGAPRANIPQRMMVPSRERGMPREWSQALEEATLAEFRLHFGRIGGGKVGFVTAKIVGLKRRLSPRALVQRAIRAMS